MYDIGRSERGSVALEAVIKENLMLHNPRA
jgi:hypothetical protein